MSSVALLGGRAIVATTASAAPLITESFDEPGLLGQSVQYALTSSDV